MFSFASDSVRELHFTEGGNVIGDSNGFTVDDYPADNLYEAAEWVAPKRYISIDEIAAPEADELDEENEFNLELTKDENNEPVLTFRRSVRREVVAITDVKTFVWPSNEASIEEIVENVERHPEQSSVTRKVEEGSEGERRLYKARHKHDGKGEKLHKSRIAKRRQGKILRQQLNELAAKAIPAEVVMHPVHWTEEEFNTILVESDFEAEAWESENEYYNWWYAHCYDYSEPEPTAQERYEAQLREERQAWEDEMSDYADELFLLDEDGGNWDELELANILTVEDDEEITLPDAQYSGVDIRATMSSDEYSYYSLFKSHDRSKNSGRGWKRNKPYNAKERKREARHAA